MYSCIYVAIVRSRSGMQLRFKVNSREQSEVSASDRVGRRYGMEEGPSDRARYLARERKRMQRQREREAKNLKIDDEAIPSPNHDLLASKRRCMKDGRSAESLPQRSALLRCLVHVCSLHGH